MILYYNTKDRAMPCPILILFLYYFIILIQPRKLLLNRLNGLGITGYYWEQSPYRFPGFIVLAQLLIEQS